MRKANHKGEGRPEAQGRSWFAKAAEQVVRVVRPEEQVQRARRTTALISMHGEGLCP